MGFNSGFKGLKDIVAVPLLLRALIVVGIFVGVGFHCSEKCFIRKKRLRGR